MGEGERWWDSIASYFAIGLWVGALFATVISLLVAIFCLPHPFAVAWLTILVSSSQEESCSNFFYGYRPLIYYVAACVYT